MTNTLATQPVHYGAYENLIDLSQHFLGEDVSTLKSSFWGYMTHSMAKVAGDAAFQRNIMYKELFLNSASLPSSIYNFAKVYNYEVRNSTPSYCRVLITFTEKELDNMFDALPDSQNYLIIPDTQLVNMESIPFVMVAPVVINRNGRQFTARYQTENKNFDVSNHIIRTNIRTDNNITKISFEINLRQAEKRFNEYNVLNTDPTDIPRYRLEVDNPDHIADFYLEYDPPSGEIHRIPLYFNDTFVPEDNEYGYYYYGNSGIEIVFSSLPNEFRPEYNSRLILHYFLSLGEGGNFNYEGTPSMTYITLNGERINPEVMILSQPAGGIDRPSLITIKNNIINDFGLRNSIITENDLTSFLKQQAEQISSRNLIKISFRRRQDDFIIRRFSCYLALRTEDDHVLPTTTCDFDIPANKMEEYSGTLKAGEAIVFDRSLARGGRAGVFRLINDNSEDPLSYQNDRNSFLYSIPYLLVLRRFPFPRATMYDTFSDSASLVKVSSSELGVVERYFLNSVSSRRFSVDEGYKFEFSLESNVISQDRIYSGEFRFIVNIKDENKTQIGQIIATAINNEFTFTLNTRDTFNSDGHLEILNSIQETAGEDTATFASRSIPPRIHLEFDLQRDRNFRNEEDADWRFVQKYETETPLIIYKNLERIINILATVNDDGDFHCKGVPLVGSRFFSNPVLKPKIIRMLSNYHIAIERIFDLFENNTSMDLKFYNTFGPAIDFSSDRVSLSMNLQIQIDGAQTENLRDNIIKKIMELVEDVDNLVDRNLSVSRIIADLHNEFDQIRNITFKSLNGVSPGTIRPLYSAQAREKLPDYVPEYLNVAMVVGEQGTLIPDIKIDFTN